MNLQPREYLMKDKFNAWKGAVSCRFLEWTGWYNYNLSQRFLGHYRLFQHFKAGYAKTHRDHHVAQTYIHQYKATGFKYFISRIFSVMYCIGRWKDFYSMGKLARINRRLVNEHDAILQEFLNSANVNFENALRNAIQQIDSPAFFKKKKDRSAA